MLDIFSCKKCVVFQPGCLLRLFTSMAFCFDWKSKALLFWRQARLFRQYCLTWPDLVSYFATWSCSSEHVVPLSRCDSSTSTRILLNNQTSFKPPSDNKMQKKSSNYVIWSEFCPLTILYAENWGIFSLPLSTFL